jgi:hypothetical protein
MVSQPVYLSPWANHFACIASSFKWDFIKTQDTTDKGVSDIYICILWHQYFITEILTFDILEENALKMPSIKYITHSIYIYCYHPHMIILPFVALLQRHKTFLLWPYSWSVHFNISRQNQNNCRFVKPRALNYYFPILATQNTDAKG